MLRRLEPHGELVEDLVGLYLDMPRESPGRPWVLMNMVASVDGGTTIDGRSSSLGDADDLQVFKAIRTVPDVILVGASTVKAEDYGPVVLDEGRRERRLAAGLAESPVLAIVSGRLSVDPDARVFSDSGHRPLIFTGAEANPSKLALLGDAAEIVFLDELAPAAILRHLGAASRVLLEGGPSLNGQFAAAGLIDEVNVTVAAKMIGGSSHRLAWTGADMTALEMELDQALMGERSLFLRYLTRREG